LARREFEVPLIIGIVVVVLILTVTVVSSYWPKYEERFFEFALLGSEKKAENYFPNQNSTIEKQTPLLWHIFLHNHMGSEQTVIVRVKLLNSTMTMPNDLNHSPSPHLPFLEFSTVLTIDDTIQLPFSWSILEAVPSNGSIVMTVNNEIIVGDVSSFVDNQLRMVFELWVYNPLTEQYEFGWDSGKGYYSTSVYMWFTITLDTE
jgi:hypothetical protein